MRPHFWQKILISFFYLTCLDLTLVNPAKPPAPVYWCRVNHIICAPLFRLLSPIPMLFPRYWTFQRDMLPAVNPLQRLPGNWVPNLRKWRWPCKRRQRINKNFSLISGRSGDRDWRPLNMILKNSGLFSSAVLTTVLPV